MRDWTISAPLILYAPAKVNLCLEVIRKRKDGYHEIASLLESVSLFDVLHIRSSDSLYVESPVPAPPDEDLVFIAVKKLEEAIGRRIDLHITVRKTIPLAAGLGGGSSDAGTVIRAIGKILRIPDATQHEIAASIGSDVPFFLNGGLAIASGTGTQLKPCQSVGRRWYVILVPNLHIPGKTGAMYGALAPSDFTDGTKTARFAENMPANDGAEISQNVTNAFQRPLLQYPEFRDAVDRFKQADYLRPIASGAGPSVFAVCATWGEASLLRKRMIVPDRCQSYLVTSVEPGINDARIERCISKSMGR
jgi:4-diphosphocytidyl-2-C-methyl-D-erythritol kinase